MGIKQYKPTTPSLRHTKILDFSELTVSEPHKPLLRPLKKTGGRGASGRITSRRRGGGHKKRYRLIDFKRDKYDIPAKVETIEYDPNRSARIALLCYADGERRYILAPKGLDVDSIVISSSSEVEIEPGNSSSLENIPIGSTVHNIELKIGAGANMARSAGTFATLTGRDGNYTLLKLPSGEVRKVHSRCQATIGIVGNLENEQVSLGKAGRSRWKGRRPKVRGVVMNPVDHPHGGGEGRTSGGRHPVSPTGVLAKGYKTRNKRKISSNFIVKRRK